MDNYNYRNIRVVQDGVKVTIFIDRPEVLNALNRETVEEALHAFETIPPQTRVLVLRGAGDRAFAAGADINELRERTPYTEMDYGPRRQLARRLETASFPTVAALNGIALGGGLELALACHLRVASASARLGLPELRLGMIPGNGGSIRLTKLVGRGRALSMLLMSEQIDAHSAKEMGLVNEVFETNDFEERLSVYVEKFTRLPPAATQALLDCVVSGAEMPLDRGIEHEHRWFQTLLGGPDKTEGIAAFLEKRRPNFLSTAR